MFLEVAHLASSTALGLLVGSWLTEAIVLVPFWRSMEPDKFLALYAELGTWIFRYFAPLTAITSVLTLVVALVPFSQGEAPNLNEVVPVVMIAIALGMFAAFFKRSIANFKAGIVSGLGLSEDLAKWARWHAVRLLIGSVAFISSLLALP